MKPVIQTLKNMKRRITGYRASFGPVSVDVSTSLPYPKQVAAAELERTLRETLARVEQGALIIRWPLLRPPDAASQMETVVVWPVIDGWGGWCSVFSSSYSVFSGFSYYETSGKTRDDLAVALVGHVIQQVWDPTLSPDDEEALIGTVPTWRGQPPTARVDLQKSLRTYFHWQREYRRLRGKGFDDTAARNILGGFQKEEE